MFLKNYANMISAFIQRGRIGQTIATWSGIKYDGTSFNNANVLDSYNQVNYAMGWGSGNNDSYPTLSPFFISNNSKIFYGSNNTSAGAAYAGVILGDGDTPVTLDDYCLSGNIITDFSAISSISTTVNNGHVYAIGTYTLTNTGLSNLEIKEIGSSIYNNNQTPAFRILIARTVLDNPLIIAPGESGTLIYKIQIL